MKKKIAYIFLALFVGGILFVFWNDFPSFWKKMSIISMIILAFFIIKDFLFWALKGIIKSLPSLLQYIITAIGAVIILLIGYSLFPENGSIKNNIAEIKTSVIEFFRLPEKPNTQNQEGVINIPSTNASTRTLTSLGSTEIQRSYSNASSSEAERKRALEAKQQEEKTITSDKTENAQPSIDPLIILLEDEQKNDEDEQKNNPVDTLEFNNNSEKNWKPPVIKDLNTPQPVTEIVLGNTQDTAISRTNTENAKDTTTITTTPRPTVTAIASLKKLPSSGIQDQKYTILFRESPVQIVYPVEYSISNALWTDKKDTIDSVSFMLTTPDNTKAQVSVDIMDSGKIFEKYKSEFSKKNSSDENIFFIEIQSDKSIEYVSFFNGQCWKIQIDFPKSMNPTLKDFYNILLPAVFEAQE